jgi:predicted nucleic acid-binding protein
MILADTSIWIDHFRHGDAVLAELLYTRNIVMHPFIIGELALGNLRQRDDILNDLQDLPRAQVANDAEVLHFIAQHALFGLGIGYIDAHLLAAARLTSNCLLWTRDKRLRGIAERMRLGGKYSH